jgi:predicted flap endonuclease-1-like 5' DNA nuclease
LSKASLAQCRGAGPSRLFAPATDAARAAVSSACAVAATAAAAAVVNVALSRTPATSVTAGDDLKRVGGIDAVMEQRLRSHGVLKFAQMAAWSDQKVAQLSNTLDIGDQIQRERWIEQAQILRLGGETPFSSQYDRDVARAVLATAGT